MDTNGPAYVKDRRWSNGKDTMKDGGAPPQALHVFSLVDLTSQ